MSKFPQWWDSTVTVYNKFTDSDRVVKWYKKTISDCFWKHVGEKVLLNNISLDTESIICRIPEQTGFKKPADWDSLSEDDKLSHFTLRQGDIIVHGDCEDDIDEYTSGKRSTDLLTKYHKLDSCLVINTVTYSTLTGFNNPHYIARGV